MEARTFREEVFERHWGVFPASARSETSPRFVVPGFGAARWVAAREMTRAAPSQPVPTESSSESSTRRGRGGRRRAVEPQSAVAETQDDPVLEYLSGREVILGRLQEHCTAVRGVCDELVLETGLPVGALARAVPPGFQGELERAANSRFLWLVEGAATISLSGAPRGHGTAVSTYSLEVDPGDAVYVPTGMRVGVAGRGHGAVLASLEVNAAVGSIAGVLASVARSVVFGEAAEARCNDIPPYPDLEGLLREEERYEPALGLLIPGWLTLATGVDAADVPPGWVSALWGALEKVVHGICQRRTLGAVTSMRLRDPEKLGSDLVAEVPGDELWSTVAASLSQMDLERALRITRKSVPPGPVPEACWQSLGRIVTADREVFENLEWRRRPRVRPHLLEDGDDWLLRLPGAEIPMDTSSAKVAKWCLAQHTGAEGGRFRLSHVRKAVGTRSDPAEVVHGLLRLGLLEVCHG